MQNINVLVDEQKVEQMFNDICALKVCELRHLQDIVCSRLSLKIIKPMTQIVEQIVQTKTSFEVKVIGFGKLSKVDTIKAVKDLKVLGLLEAKKATEMPLPWSLGVFDTQEEAQDLLQRWKDKEFEITIV